MIAHLTGLITKTAPGEVTVDVNGVGYAVTVPMDVWDELRDESERKLWVSSYIREDRFDLYGFLLPEARLLFERLIGLSGVGPKLGLELCAVPRELIHRAISSSDSTIITTVKGVGKKMAEKLLVELKALNEKFPHFFATEAAVKTDAGLDQDAIEALLSLGYDQVTVVKTLATLPTKLNTTEQRVTAALQAL